jgi:hypothetical protein
MQIFKAVGAKLRSQLSLRCETFCRQNVQFTGLTVLQRILQKSLKSGCVWAEPGAPCAVFMNTACVSGVIKFINLLALLHNIKVFYLPTDAQ